MKANKSLEDLGEDVFKSATQANNLKTMKTNMAATLEFIVLLSAVRKAKYDALVKEGFTEAQALEIVIKTPLYG